MELHAVDLARGVRERRERRSSRSRAVCDEAGRQRIDAVAVATSRPSSSSPAVERCGTGPSPPASTRTRRRGRTRALSAGVDLAAEQLRGELRAVADAEDRHAELEDAPAGSSARPRRRPTIGPPESTMPIGAIARELRRSARERVRMDLAVDALLADPARDQLRVLRAEIEDEDELMRHAALRYSTR